jgi:hypothetical protein
LGFVFWNLFLGAWDLVLSLPLIRVLITVFNQWSDLGFVFWNLFLGAWDLALSLPLIRVLITVFNQWSDLVLGNSWIFLTFTVRLPLLMV